MTITSRNQYPRDRRNVWYVSITKNPISDRITAHVVYYRTKAEIKAHKDVNPAFTVSSDDIIDAVAHLPIKAQAVIRNPIKVITGKYDSRTYYNTMEEA